MNPEKPHQDNTGKDSSKDISIQRNKNRSRDAQEVFEKPENWYTEYQAAKELGISRENLHRYLLEYKTKEPDYIVNKEEKLFLYKNLIQEIDGRIKSGEKRIIPENWITLQEFADNISSINDNMPMKNILEYLFDDNAEIKKLWEEQFYKSGPLGRFYGKPEMVLRDKDEFYFSPEFQNILKQKIVDLKEKFIPDGYSMIDFMKIMRPFAEKAQLRNDVDYLKKVTFLLKELKDKYKNSVINKIIDFDIEEFYPPELLSEFEKEVSKLD
jgi:predicted transcriptional regulator